MFSSISKNVLGGGKALAMSRFGNYMLIVFIFGCLISYIYFANAAVRTLTVLEKTKGEMQNLSVEVSDLESKRFAIDNSVDASLAGKLGFVEVQNPNFIIKGGKNTALSLKD